MAAAPDIALEVRGALPSEVDRAARTALTAFQQFRERLPAAEWTVMAESIRSTTALEKGGELLLALFGGRIAGSVIYCRPGGVAHDLFPADWAYMRALAVAPAFRGCGAGRCLAQACLERARLDGARTFGLHTAEEMPAARRIYADLGFRVMKDAPPYFGFRYRIYCLDLA